MIKEECLLYVSEVNQCNALIETKCSGCSFYKKATEFQKEMYKIAMKEKGMYLKPTKSKKKKGNKNR